MRTSSTAAIRYHRALMPRGSGMESYGATVLRVFLGVIYIMHAYLALFVFGPSGMVSYQSARGIPFPEIGTWYLIIVHGLGGLCLVLGIFVRSAARSRKPCSAPARSRSGGSGPAPPATEARSISRQSRCASR